MYTAIMNGLDVIIFTGGIGENVSIVRSLCCSSMENLGIVIDEKRNRDIIGIEGELNEMNSLIKILCIPIDEELIIARDTACIVRGLP
jgi:acetate kinase